MKVYFEDGMLTRSKTVPDWDVIIDATTGVRANLETLDYCIFKSDRVKTIYTNSILAFNNKYAWNEDLKTPEVYIRDDKDEWCLIQDLTDKELRCAHNLSKMYIAGVFTGKKGIDYAI